MLQVDLGLQKSMVVWWTSQVTSQCRLVKFSSSKDNPLSRSWWKKQDPLQMQTSAQFIAILKLKTISLASLLLIFNNNIRAQVLAKNLSKWRCCVSTHKCTLSSTRTCSLKKVAALLKMQSAHLSVSITTRKRWPTLWNIAHLHMRNWKLSI